MKKLVTLAITLLLAGIGLTLYLPAYEPGQAVDRAIPYQVDQDSLKTPYPMEATLLSAINPTENYALQLGLFGDLEQAISQARKYALSEKPTILKTKDRQRYWFLLLLGPYPTKQMAKDQMLALLKNHQIQSKLAQWPGKVTPPAEQASDLDKVAEQAAIKATQLAAQQTDAKANTDKTESSQ